VDLHNCGAFLEAGAYTVAVGSSLVSEQLVSQLGWRGLTLLADQFVRACSTPAND
jgi:2-dehydro-3-deoxyphosphogluconate aldolase/(4S)-4-hydroxy-2-oxoglutarate aldolase